MKKVLCLGFCFSLMADSAINQSAWIGEKYDKNSSLQYKVGVDAVYSFNLNGTERVLDIGCGNGKITALCASRLHSGSLVAIDSSESMITFARNSYGQAANLTFNVQDVTTMTFDQEFDFVYSIFCLHWVKDQETAIKNIARSLKPGGKAVLIITVPNQFNTRTKELFCDLVELAPWRKFKEQLGYDHHVVPVEVWLGYAKRCGLTAEYKTIHDEVVYPNYEALKQRYSAYGICAKVLQIMDSEQGNIFVDAILGKLYQDRGLSKDQPYMVASDGVIITLTK